MHFGQGETESLLVHLGFQALIHPPVGVLGLKLLEVDFDEQQFAIGEKFPEQLLGIPAGGRANKYPEEIGVMVVLFHEAGGMGMEYDPGALFGHPPNLDDEAGKASLFSRSE